MFLKKKLHTLILFYERDLMLFNSFFGIEVGGWKYLDSVTETNDVYWQWLTRKNVSQLFICGPQKSFLHHDNVIAKHLYEGYVDIFLIEFV